MELPPDEMSEDSADTSADLPMHFACPGCGEEVESAREERARIIACPYCSTEMVIPAVDGTTDLAEELEAAERNQTRREMELSAQRIRLLAAGRRAAIRSRTYALLAAAGCGFAIVRFVIATANELRLRTWTIRPIAYGLFIIVAGLGMGHFLRRAARYQAESRASALEEPGTPPDFSTLSDGSHVWKNLDEMKGRG